MGRSIEVSGTLLVYVFYASSLAIVPVLLYFAVFPLDDLTSIAGAVLLAVLVLVAAADLWYWKSGSLRDHLDRAARRDIPYDITYRPNADPGDAARHYWTKAVRRLPGGDDDDG
jgi:hypothetical protein